MGGRAGRRRASLPVATALLGLLSSSNAAAAAEPILGWPQDEQAEDEGEAANRGREEIFWGPVVISNVAPTPSSPTVRPWGMDAATASLTRAAASGERATSG